MLTIGGIVQRVFGLLALSFVLQGRCQAVSPARVPSTFICSMEGERLPDAFIAWADQACAESCRVRHVQFEPDVPMSEAEFVYLTDVYPGNILSPTLMKKAVRYLQKKRLFKAVTIKTERYQDDVDLHIMAQAWWTFAALKIHGLITDKDSYRRYYLLQPGEPFNEEKHTRSMEGMQDALCRSGYYAATITTRLEYDQVCKTVTVHSTINRGKQFGIGDLKLIVQPINVLSEEAVQSLRLEIEKRFFSPLKKRIYKRDQVAQQATRLRAFLAERGFFNAGVKITEKIDVEKHKVDLFFTLRLHQPREFIFVGNSFFTKAQLRDSLTLFGRSASVLPESVLKKELLLLYETKGFFDTQIETKQEVGRLFFVIQEGRRSTLASITLRGCTVYDPQCLVQEYCQECTRAPYIDQALIQKALGAITTLYADKGFLDARVVECAYEKTDDTHARTLVVTLDEGPLYTITSSHVEGKPEYSSQGPFVACNHGQKIAFTTEELRKQREWLLEELNKDQDHQVTVRPHIEREGTQVGIIWYCSSERYMCFGKTVVVGAPTVPFECIMREFFYKQKDQWDSALLKKSAQALRALGIFNRVDIHPESNDEYLQDKTIIAQLQMDDPYEIRLRGGLGFQQVSHEFNFLGFTYRAGGTFIVKNPLNQADQVCCELDFAKFDTKIVASYRRPWLFGVPLNTLFQLYHSRQSHPGIIKSSENIYQVTQQGCMTTVSYAHTYGTVGINAGIEYMETSTADAAGQNTCVADDLARAINFSPQLLNKKVPYILLEPTVLVDRLDNNLQPTQGTFTLISLKGMFPLSVTGGRSYFVRCSLEQSFLIPLRHVVAAFRVRLGHIFHDSFKTIMPPERFYLGGAHSLRAYDMDFAPPLGIFKDSAGVLHKVPRGGKSMVNFNIELRIPVYKRVGVVFFQDLGGLSSDTLAVLQSHNLLTATGFGLRYDTIFGPLRFDIGWKWPKNQSFDTSYAWFLTLGQAF